MSFTDQLSDLQITRIIILHRRCFANRIREIVFNTAESDSERGDFDITPD